MAVCEQIKPGTVILSDFGTEPGSRIGHTGAELFKQPSQSAQTPTFQPKEPIADPTVINLASTVLEKNKGFTQIHKTSLTNLITMDSLRNIAEPPLTTFGVPASRPTTLRKR